MAMIIVQTESLKKRLNKEIDILKQLTENLKEFPTLKFVTSESIVVYPFQTYTGTEIHFSKKTQKIRRII